VFSFAGLAESNDTEGHHEEANGQDNDNKCVAQVIDRVGGIRGHWHVGLNHFISNERTGRIEAGPDDS
jgi:hypothetical protein